MDKPKVQKAADKPVNPDAPEKKERKKHEDKKPKHQRNPEYDRNADAITEDTVLEPLPKKGELLKKPELKDFQERESKNREKITKFIQKKKQIFEQKFKPTKTFVKGEGGAHQDFQIQIEEFSDLKKRFGEARDQRNQKRDFFSKLIQEAKANNNDLKKFRESQKNSKQYFESVLEKLEHRLITDQLSKEQQKNLNTQILSVKRKVKDAESVGNVQVKIAKAEQRKQQLDAEIEKLKVQKQPLEEQCKRLKEQMDAKNAQIEKLKGEIKNQKDQKTETKEKNNVEYENWKQSKKKRVDELNLKIKQLDDLNKKIWEQYNLKNDAYWEQKHKVDFLEWQHRVKERKIRDKQRQAKRAIAIEKEKQREKEQQLQKYIKEIELCNFLIGYCRDLTQENKQVKQQKKAEQPKDINAKLGEDSQWKKEKGLIVLQSKKSKEDEQEPTKKGKKHKKKNQKAEETAKKFEVPFNIQLLFEQLKLLAPASLEEVEKKIQELLERQELFKRACSEEVSQGDRQEIEKIKAVQKKERKEKKAAKHQQDFPTL